MLSGIYTFDQIILDIQDETGYTNLVNRYPEIKRLILRAERVINPFYSVLVKKRMRLFKGNGNFNGRRFMLEPDYMFFDKVGSCEFNLCESQYYQSRNHIVICDGSDRDEIIYSYWALAMDEEGNPFTTYNHAEAVVAYVVWKMISQRTFLGQATRSNRNGSLNSMEYYKQKFEELARYSSGEDFFPTDLELRNLNITNNTNKYTLYYDLGNRVDGCIMEECLNEFKDKEEKPLYVRAWYFQLDKINNPSDDAGIINLAWLEANAFELTEEELLEGLNFSQNKIGQIGFALEIENDYPYLIKNVLDLDITNSVFLFKQYDPIEKIKKYLSKSVYSTGSLYFKFEK